MNTKLKTFTRLTMVSALLLWGAACSKIGETSAQSSQSKPEAIGPHECGACGMVVREQPAPRAQVVHRDGERVFLCSIADAVQYLSVPSPHGKVTEILVETLEASADPRSVSSQLRPWARPKEAGFVTGIDRPKVMGNPVLVYESPEVAQKVARRAGGTLTTWQALLENP